MYRSIIVPLDGSARSQAALPVAAALAHASGATLDLVRVHLDERPDLADDPSWDGMFREGERNHLESLALAYAGIAGTQVGTALLDPPVVESLVEFAAERSSPLIVMVGRGRTGLRRALLGSTADGIVRAGDTPVIVLRDRGPDDPPAWKASHKPFGRIVLPLDGSAHAEGAIAHAVAVARATGAKLRFVRVIGPVMTSAVLSAFAMHPLIPYDESTAIRNDVAEDYLQGVVDRVLAGGEKLDVSTEVALGTDAATSILESCRRFAAGLIVLPTHGRGASRMIVESVGDRVLRDGPDAVMFVKPVRASLPAGLTEGRANQKGHSPAQRAPVVVR
jgi:nucleotide-binding universal stress UspA family protein